MPIYSRGPVSSDCYVAKANRKTQSRFACSDCSFEIHADVSAARNLESGRLSSGPGLPGRFRPVDEIEGGKARRVAFDPTAHSTKADALRLTVLRHLELLYLERTTTWARVSPAERLRRNGYYAPFLGAGPDGPMTRILPP